VLRRLPSLETRGHISQETSSHNWPMEGGRKPTQRDSDAAREISRCVPAANLVARGSQLNERPRKRGSGDGERATPATHRWSGLKGTYAQTLPLQGIAVEFRARQKRLCRRTSGQIACRCKREI